MELTKIFKYVSYGLIGLSAVICLLFFAGAITENFFLVWTYILIGVACVATVAFSIMGMITHPKNAKNALIGFGAMIVVFGLAYALGSSEIPKFLGYQKFDITPGLSKTVGGSLYAIYLLLTLAIVGIVYSEVSKALKR